MKVLNSRYILLTIIVVASILRLWHLGTNPPHLTPDEAALGYNAYSILKTGRDEYGTFMPIIFKSFGDFKPGLYVYATIPFIATLGLTEFAVRLPSAIAGVIAVWLMYTIIFEFFDRKVSEGPFKNPQLLALLSAAVLAVSPWHIHFSRGAWEVNLALTLTLAGTYFFLKALKDIKYIYPSAVLFAVTLVTYQGAKLSVLIVLALLSIIHFNQIKRLIISAKSVKHIVFSGVLAIIIALPILLSFTSGQTGRLKVFSVFSYKRPPEYLAQQLDHAQVKNGSLKYYLDYSENLNTLRGIMGRWFNHYTGRFLFFEGDWQNPRHSAPDTGEMLLTDIVFLVLGLGLMSTKLRNKSIVFFLAWLILAPLPSALSRDQVHAVRSLNLVIPLTVVVSLGLYRAIEIISQFKSSLIRNASYLGIGALYVFSGTLFLDNYFVHQPIHNSQFWNYGYKQIVETITPIQNTYKTIRVRQSYAQPYIYFLFFQKYDPATYQHSAHLTESKFGDVGTVDQLDNIEFTQIDWARDRGDEGVLFVTDPINVPPQDSSDPNYFKVIKEIPYLDGKETAFRIIEVLNNQ